MRSRFLGLLLLAGLLLAAAGRAEDLDGELPEPPEVGVAVHVLTSAPAEATPPTTGPHLDNGLRLMGEDLRHVVTEPFRGGPRGRRARNDILKTFTLTLGTAWLLDRPVRDFMRKNQDSGRSDVADVLEDLGDWNTLNGVGALTLLAGAVGEDRRTTDLGFDLLTANLISGGVTDLLKNVAGRERPAAYRGADDWRGFGGGSSFPSGHASHAFAMAEVLAEHRVPRWIRRGSRLLAYLIALSRVYDDRHYLSDVVAGAFLGASIGRTVARHNRERRGRPVVMPVLGEEMAGLAVSTSLGGESGFERVADTVAQGVVQPLKWVQPRKASFRDKFLLVAGTAWLLDEEARRLWRSNRSGGLADSLDELGDSYGDLSLPLVGATWLGGALSGNSRAKAFGEDGVVAMALGGLWAAMLKPTIGRSRPERQRGAHEFDPFAGDFRKRAFPSGHTTPVFALAAVARAHRMPPWVRHLTFGGALLVAHHRLNQDVHWLSDVVGGAFLGDAIGRWVARRGQRGRRRVEVKPVVLDGGVGVGVGGEF